MIPLKSPALLINRLPTSPASSFAQAFISSSAYYSHPIAIYRHVPFIPSPFLFFCSSQCPSSSACLEVGPIRKVTSTTTTHQIHPKIPIIVPTANLTVHRRRASRIAIQALTLTVSPSRVRPILPPPKRPTCTRAHPVPKNLLTAHHQARAVEQCLMA